ncbi:MAG: hypothetical protein HFJ52_00130 [Clostridia bacterium]|jgi:hypothetical protein|nr:hypothetical protein [Clostridia bacterium]
MKFRTRKWKNDFKTSNDKETWYDIEKDWAVVATSLKTQYGYSVREKIETMSWGELIDDISCLSAETPLRESH